MSDPTNTAGNKDGFTGSDHGSMGLTAHRTAISPTAVLQDLPEYVPCVIVLDDPKRTELMLRDCAVVWSFPNPQDFDLAYDMETGELVGMRVYADVSARSSDRRAAKVYEPTAVSTQPAALRAQTVPEGCDDKPDALICIRCNARLVNIQGADNQPAGGTEFSTAGHYGSCVTDLMDGTRHIVNVCDVCLSKAIARGAAMKVPPHTGRAAAIERPSSREDVSTNPPPTDGKDEELGYGLPWEAGKAQHTRLGTEGIFELGDTEIYPSRGPGPVAIAAGDGLAEFIVCACNAYFSLQSELTSSRLSLSDKDKEIERLKAALEPFAALDGEGSEDHADDTKVVVQFGRVTDHTLTLADIRRASSAIIESTTPSRWASSPPAETTKGGER